MGVPVVTPSNTPDKISGSPASSRCETMRLWPGRRRARSTLRSSTSSGSPGGQPSTITTLAGPWDSPAVVTTKRSPMLLPDTGAEHRAQPARLPTRPTSLDVWHNGSVKPEALTAQELAWLEADEALWRRAHAIVERHPALDLTDVYHTLKNFQRTPAQRLQRGLAYGRAGAQRT